MKAVRNYLAGLTLAVGVAALALGPGGAGLVSVSSPLFVLAAAFGSVLAAVHLRLEWVERREEAFREVNELSDDWPPLLEPLDDDDDDDDDGGGGVG